MPISLSALTSLKVLRLKQSNTLSLPAFLRTFIRLELLQLTAFSNLQSLPDWLDELACLQTLDLQHCTRLTAVPECVSLLGKLQCLQMTGCSGLQILRQGIGQLPNLQALLLDDCPDLQAQGFLGRSSALEDQSQSTYSSAWLPASLNQLTTLQLLALKSCSGLVELGEGLDWIKNLEHLDLRSCTALHSLPETLGNHARLQHLCLENCVSLDHLPASVGSLSKLRIMNVRGCTGLQDLPAELIRLSGLQQLDASGLGSIKPYHCLWRSLAGLVSLQKLAMEDVTCLRRLPAQLLQDLPSLTFLSLKGMQQPAAAARASREAHPPCRLGDGHHRLSRSCDARSSCFLIACGMRLRAILAKVCVAVQSQ